MLITDIIVQDSAINIMSDFVAVDGHLFSVPCFDTVG